MNLIRAESNAKELMKKLEPFCDRIEIVGKIRHRKQDIDRVEILLIPKGALLFELMAKLTEMGRGSGLRVAEKQTVILKDEVAGNIEADLWFTTPDKWPVMQLLKTGGAKSNKRIQQLCEQRKWQLSASKGTIFDEDGKRLLILEEKDIFKLLGIKYLEPSWRD